MGIKSELSIDGMDEEVARYYALNIHCEDTGNTWISNSSRYRFDGSGVIVNAKNDGCYYTSGMYGRLERRAAYVFSEIMKRKISPCKIDSLPDWLCGTQLEAIEKSSNSNISLIVGGPGTGKTTIASILSNAHQFVIGLSPTGKGADRLADSLRISNCFTIHRLYFNEFLSDETVTEKLIETWELIDLIIVDEMGMTGTDGLCMLAMLANKAKNARIVMIGDSGQLPSVTPGNVLSQLAECLPSTVLDVVYRTDDYHIGMACCDARIGKIYNPKGRYDNYELHEGSNSEVAINLYNQNSKEFGSHETRLITFHTRDAWQINRRLAFTSYNHPVVCDKNNYRLGIFNGQTGTLKGKRLIFKDNSIGISQILWSYAFGSTCHKAQGSQWDCVIVWIPSNRYISPQWLNTAESRAVKKLVIVLDTDVTSVEKCMRTNAKAADRISLLAAFVQGRAKWLTASGE